MRDQKLWTWHVLAGVAILVLGGLHMIVMHLDTTVGAFSPKGGEAIDWANVAARAQSAAFLVTYVLLLGAALYHGLYGLRNILLELGPRPALRRAVTGVLLVGGILLFVAGTWAAWASHRLAASL
jgi:succinate dehydrogenase / fumarate reductase membrane anchor subunit